ncbi:MAG TPA: bifunctional aspartate transaminase/aspartate 4-decarboxylase, partial [bacterium]|nr:bifunctional aspartate transaminase/aspartate 4-decarboxylase [bacterium]
MRQSVEKKYEGLSPFELKDKLISIAKAHADRAMLNAGRGNPNWVSVAPRQAFCQLGLFAVEEAERVVDLPAIGGAPDRGGVAARFSHFLERNDRAPGAEFLGRAFAFACKEMKMDPDAVMFELVDAMTGDHYPEPDRMLPCCEKIVRTYLRQEVFSGDPAADGFDLFATEGGTAAMDYVFRSLIENKLLHKGDKIAMGTPIFTPYIEIPRLSDYRFVELELEQNEEIGWQYPDSEIDKLADPAVKIFFLVNPANPASVAVSTATLERIAKIVKTKRRDLIIVTDDVYGTFVNGFRSLAAAIPENTILVYSFSKYFGATGWRLGVIGIHEQNSFDRRIATLPEKTREELHKRYSTVALNPARMKLIDRMVAESRSVALHHTAGLSTPQQ